MADAYIAFGSLLLVIAIIPNIRARVVMPYRACLLTASVLTSWVPMYVYLGLYMTATLLTLSAGGWWALVWTRWRTG